MADAADSKSVILKRVRVQGPPSARRPTSSVLLRFFSPWGAPRRTMRVSFRSITVIAIAHLVTACGSTSIPAGTSTAPTRRGDAGPRVDDSGALIDAPTCASVVEEHPSEGNLHMGLCSPLFYATNPPSSGNHYPIWAAYQTYAQPLLPGFWVHNLEHGAIVMAYNCPQG